MSYSGLTNVGYVNADGKPLNLAELREKAPKKAKPASQAEPSFKGWAVKGYAPGRIAAAKRVADNDMESWGRLAPDEQASAIRRGDRAPSPWDLQAFLRKNKPTRVMSRLLQIRSAAEVAVKLAEKDGWEFVEIESVGRQPKGG